MKQVSARCLNLHVYYVVEYHFVFFCDCILICNERRYVQKVSIMLVYCAHCLDYNVVLLVIGD